MNEVLLISQVHYLSVCDSNGSIFFYKFENTLELLDVLVFGMNIQEIHSFLFIDDNVCLVALGGVDKHIHLYEMDVRKYPNKACQLKYLTTLKGHQNVIMDLKF